MIPEIPLTFDINETPTEYADRLALIYSNQVSNEHKKSLGQFFTPLPVAYFLAQLDNTTHPSLRILDPGCGIGILSSALCQHLVTLSKTVKEIALTAFETDIEILPFAEKCYTYLGQWLKIRGIEFTFFLCKNDFVLHNSHLLGIGTSIHEEYDIIISNPPYFKLPKGDLRIEASKAVIKGQTNIYSIFMIIAAKLLKAGGKLIFITPRSFCSGGYFRLFRAIFFDLIDLELIHVFNSRSSAFKRDKIQQENIIVVGTLKNNKKSSQMQITFGPEVEKRITISSSEGISDIAQRSIKSYPACRLVNLDSYQKTLFLPTTHSDELILERFNQWTGSFEDFGIKISTGPVVDFRNLDIIKDIQHPNTVPLIWLHNVFPLKINWPSIQNKGKTKGQYILYTPDTRSKLVENQNYVLLRRFSAKNDKSRLVAAPHLKHDRNTPMIGIENHLNYIYRPKHGLLQEEAMGIAILMNSKPFDLYFRTFNGNINVSATELRNFPLPSLELITKLGKGAIVELKKGGNVDIENIVNKFLN